MSLSINLFACALARVIAGKTACPEIPGLYFPATGIPKKRERRMDAPGPTPMNPAPASGLAVADVPLIQEPIIGLTGSFGSGCSTVARILQEKFRFEPIRLSDFIKEQAAKDGITSS